MLPIFESKASPDEHDKTVKWRNTQIQLILDQEKDEVPAKYIKIRCGCNKFISWMFMYKCLYCGVWFCKDCAEQHFGFAIE